jgi:cold shock protein
MVTGTVKWFDAEKGFGFIGTEGGDHFVHHSDIVMEGYRELSEDDEVAFDSVQGERGLQAKNVIPR